MSSIRVLPLNYFAEVSGRKIHMLEEKFNMFIWVQYEILFARQFAYHVDVGPIMINDK